MTPLRISTDKWDQQCSQTTSTIRLVFTTGKLGQNYVYGDVEPYDD